MDNINKIKISINFYIFKKIYRIVYIPELAEVKLMAVVAKSIYLNAKMKDIDILYSKYRGKGMPKLFRI